MNPATDFNLESKTPDMKTVASHIRALAQSHRGDCLALLDLLREIENLHREIRDGLFLETLPDNRQALYALLRDIEASGGWPYIERMKLRSLLANFSPEEADNPYSEGAISPETYPLESESEG